MSDLSKAIKELTEQLNDGSADVFKFLSKIGNLKPEDEQLPTPEDLELAQAFRELRATVTAVAQRELPNFLYKQLHAIDLSIRHRILDAEFFKNS